jgi:paraquat-inducible protein B
MAQAESGLYAADVSGLEVGQLSKLNLNGDGKVTGEMTVDPSVVSLLREKTLIQMKKPKISLDNPSVSALLTGTTFELVPGEGEPRNQFAVLPADKSILEEPDVATVTLTAPESYGIDAGQPLILHGVQIGQVLERKLNADGVTFQVAVMPSTVLWYAAIANSWSTAASTLKSASMAWSSSGPAPANGSTAGSALSRATKGRCKAAIRCMRTRKRRWKTA